MLKEKWMDALKHLGMGRLCHPVFCHCPVALRLEVGEPNLPVGAAYFARAGQFVERLFHRLDACFDLLWHPVCLSEDGGADPGGRRASCSRGDLDGWWG